MANAAARRASIADPDLSIDEVGFADPQSARITRMPRFVPSTMSEIFYELEQVGSKDYGGVFLRAELGDTDLVYSSSWGSPARIARTAYTLKASKVDMFLVVLGIAGEATLRQEGRVARIKRGSLALIDSSKIYEVEVSSAWKAIWLKVPRSALETRLFTYRDWLGRALPTDTGLGFAANRMIHACLHASKALRDDEARVLASNVLDIVTATFTHAEDDDGIGRSRHTEIMFNRVNRFVDQHLRDSSLGPAAISAACGISERYLRQLFASHGTTMTAAIRSKRLEECRRLLNGYGRHAPSVTQVAFSMGFENISSFNRAFKAYFGLTPSQTRSTCLSAGAEHAAARAAG
ncbi:helix-turn-helix domain-containing protein [Novosphingobium sp. ST904]|uniref:helix-turn-helix domain-containing protein n=1 Tax=Novosphingobium sp. ST904 TaxID=1684385 RepID=UPI0006C8BF85|nr:helix-turn-helix domain-containing protein [Novosphingobium sp. ST904]KPH64042.1 hypothetical protein ADT71_12125 [Novosphingobium sp. ST904]TCM32482.1 AraC family transcriptional regulator [Novosphingobium sp. ST904]